MKSKSIAIVAGLVLVSVSLMAQPTSPPPTPLPIDGGIGLLVAGCVGFGIKTMRNKRKK
ncbi:MAG: hypothetical protein RLZZ46_1564 [Bacteroidota bacterium]|jgi:hypothetical protein